MANQRKRIWIDRFQTYLMIRIAVYCIIYQIAVWTIVAIARNFAEPLETFIGATSFTFVFAAISVVCLGALFIYDAVKFTHRVVGPLVRFRKAIRAITNRDELELLRLREGDFLLDMRDEFNEMLKALEQRGAISLKTPAAKRDAGQPAAV